MDKFLRPAQLTNGVEILLVRISFFSLFHAACRDAQHLPAVRFLLAHWLSSAKLPAN